ncbi:uncharacterized protein YqeY [Caulobacter ginsengisoli]|uniref:Uncharacterized protein YqeY n=1 Tax=Caulobacter ginsengisoli TaxID=400775 RepID=A0ABU0IVT6_9CAUL|nr:hypothetical protein [Caulobacter ginsengisoli]MDQ0466134.1 uncharacterized protein YqeY [Caulobacter ginsengisoli]
MSDAVTDPAEALQTRLRADLRAAMKARETLEVSLLRGLIAAIDNAQSAGIQAGPSVSAAPAASSQWMAAGGAFGSGEVSRRVLTATDLVALLADEAARREATAAEMDRVGRADLADTARAEAAVIARYRG